MVLQKKTTMPPTNLIYSARPESKGNAGKQEMVGPDFLLTKTQL